MTRQVPVVGPRLRRVLVALLFLFACLAINSFYLAGITLMEWLTQASLQNLFYQWMFVAHLLLGISIIVPTLVYGAIHYRNARSHRNRRAVKAGYVLFITALVLIASGLMLTRGIPFVELRAPQGRVVAYWLHVITPLVATWLYVLHRLAGKRIRWQSGGGVLALATVLSAVAIVIQSQDPRQWNQTGPESGEQYFFPSLARTTDGQFISPQRLNMDSYCQECHQDAHQQWAHSVHRFSSFNNPVYAFSVQKTREFLKQRDGHVQAVRFCAGCHDPVPFFSGAMDDDNFGLKNEPLGQAGITCSVCHAITHVNSPRGNADYTIEAPLHYPFTFSQQPVLQWVNRMLVKAKPAFHKKTFLKPLHKSPEFCGSCHKVHLPKELNGYRWLRGQNHYDSFLLSGVSGHGIRSFYYPSRAEENCNDCHMPRLASHDFGARRYNDSPDLQIHNHQFPAANTAIPQLLEMPEWVNQAHREVLAQSVTVDVFALRKQGRIDGELIAPIQGGHVQVEAGETYLLEVVLRTRKLGHVFTGGTADSNQVWLSVQAKQEGRTVASSGELQSSDNQVDPAAHFVNAYVIDRQGHRIDRRNPENIFTQLYNNQIPPGGAEVVHYLLTVPESLNGVIDLNIALNYRKFDNTLMAYVWGDEFVKNELPVSQLDSQSIQLWAGESEPVNHDGDQTAQPAWERWNDYGIGLFRQQQFRQAEHAFVQVERLGHGTGALNLARVYLAEGRLDEAALALQRAARAAVPAYPWSVSYFTAQLNLQNGFFDEAIAAFKQLIDTQFADARSRGYDFSKDYRLLNELAGALAERAKLERGYQGEQAARQLREKAVGWYKKSLDLDPENVNAHYGLAQLFELLGDTAAAAQHRMWHAQYKIDDNAKDRAIQLARARDNDADHATNRVVIYRLSRSNLPVTDVVKP